MKNSSAWAVIIIAALSGATFGCHNFAEVSFGRDAGVTTPTCAPAGTDTQTDPDSCGGDCRMCPAAATADQVSACRMGVCGFDCSVAGQILVDGRCFPAPRSCGDPTLKCGADDDSCCEFAPRIPGGVLSRSWDISDQGTQYDGATLVTIQGWSAKEAAKATVLPFFLDRYEVTVGRFRRFYEGYDNFLREHPITGDGRTRKAGSGWNAAWSSNLVYYAHDALTLRMRVAGCDQAVAARLDTAGMDDKLPMSCITWHEALLFCVYDGARLPTEAEWNFAAAAGTAQLPYPWGRPDPLGVPPGYGNVGASGVTPVGSFPAGRGRDWFHHDLAGNVEEYVYDTCGDPLMTGKLCSSYTDPNAIDPLNDMDLSRVQRGGSYRRSAAFARTAYRQSNGMGQRWPDTGFRCARTAESQ